MMNAIEFQTTLTDAVVRVPNYQQFLNKPIRVIILDNSSSPKTPSRRDGFIHSLTHKPVTLPPGSSFLSRDEAHER